MPETQWEHVALSQIDRDGYSPSYFGSTMRLRVPGGWIYLTTFYTNQAGAMPVVSQVFVSEAETVPGRRGCGPRSEEVRTKEAWEQPGMVRCPKCKDPGFMNCDDCEHKGKDCDEDHCPACPECGGSGAVAKEARDA